MSWAINEGEELFDEHGNEVDADTLTLYLSCDCCDMSDEYEGEDEFDVKSGAGDAGWALSADPDHTAYCGSCSCDEGFDE